MDDRSAFSGGDQGYLRDIQYATTAKLDARSHLHRTYSTSPIRLGTFAARLVEWPPDAAVLECGCGSGQFWTDPELPRGMSLTLTDLSPGMVEAAVSVAREHGFDDVRGEVCDIQSLPFADDAFDVVVANHMLYHVPDPDRAISEIARVVRPDGVVLAATNGRGHMRELNDAIAEVLGDHGEQLYDVFGIETGEARLRERFASIAWHAFDNDLVVDDPGPVFDYAVSFPPGESADDDQRRRLAATIADRFTDGRLRIRTRTGAFVARTPRHRNAR